MARLSTWVPIRALSRRHKVRVSRHLLALDSHDRYLRFGFEASDRRIADRAPPRLRGRRGAGHLQPSPGTDRAGPSGPCGPTVADFGVSVLAHARGHRLGRRLFDAASLHARNRGIDTLIQALAINQPMLRIARAAGRRSNTSAPTPRLASGCQGLTERLRHIAQWWSKTLAEWDLQMKQQAGAGGLGRGLAAWPVNNPAPG